MDRTLIVHWGRTGGGPLFMRELTRAWIELSQNDIHASFNSNSDSAAEMRSLVTERHEVTTYTNSAQLVAKLPTLILKALRLRRYIKKYRIHQVVSAMDSVYQSLCVPIALPRKTAYTIIVHDGQLHPGEDHIIRRIGRRIEERRADSIVVLSTAVENQVRQRNPGKPVVRSVHPAFSVRNPPTGPRRLDGSRIKVGFFGRLQPYKGLELFLELTEDHQLSERFEFEIWGNGEVAELQADPRAKAIRWNVGWVPESEIVQVLAGFDLLLLPYREASQSGVLSYAMSVGLPVVTTPVGGLAEQVHETGSGAVAQDASAISLSKAIRELVASPEQYEAASRNAMRSARTSHSWKRLAVDVRAALRR